MDPVTAENIWASLMLASPEAGLAVGLMGLLLVGAFLGEGSGRAVAALTGVLLIACAAWLLEGLPDIGGAAFGGTFVADPLAEVSKVVIIASAVAALVLSQAYLGRERLMRFEYPILIGLAVLGMMIMVSARDLITLYLGLELQSLSLYVLAAFNRDSERASEAGLKYFVLGALSSGILLYGMSLVYGFSGATRFDEIAAVVAAGDVNDLGLLFGLVFVICGLAFKVSAAPFHMWTPDVYEGAPTPVTAFFAAAPKLAAMVLFARVLHEPFPDLVEQWRQVLIAIAALSMVIGSLGALAQTNVKRLMAYSSIANMGFALVALCGGGPEGVEGMLLFMVIYVISTTGVFACILAMRRTEGMVEDIGDLAGLSRTHPWIAAALTMLLFSIAGIPPLAGFFGKFFAFLPAAQAGLWWLVVLAVVASVISAFYYLRLIRLMWFEDAREPLASAPGELTAMAAGAAALTFPILILPFAAAPGRELLAQAAASLF